MLLPTPSAQFLHYTPPSPLFGTHERNFERSHKNIQETDCRYTFGENYLFNYWYAITINMINIIAIIVIIVIVDMAILYVLYLLIIT
jgi:hypothetical protein